MSLTYKKNVADSRKTLVQEVIKELEQVGVDIFGYDPLLGDIEGEFGIKVARNLEEIKVDGIIATVAHKTFQEITVPFSLAIYKSLVLVIVGKFGPVIPD